MTRLILPVTARTSTVDGWRCPPDLWAELQFVAAWADGSLGPCLKVPRDAEGDRFVHRVRPRWQAGRRVRVGGLTLTVRDAGVTMDAGLWVWVLTLEGA